MHLFKVVGILKPTGSVIDQLILTTSATIWHVHEHESEENESTHADTTEVSTHQTDAHHEDMHGHIQDENSPTTPKCRCNRTKITMKDYCSIRMKISPPFDQI